MAVPIADPTAFQPGRCSQLPPGTPDTQCALPSLVQPSSPSTDNLLSLSTVALRDLEKRQVFYYI